MNPEKIDPMSITSIREIDVESIVEWFDQHIQSFYILGWSYLRNQQQMEELFYRSIIKVHKELPRYKQDISFKMWVTSIFIHTCRELSDDKRLQDSEKGVSRQELFNVLDQLIENEREAVVLTYSKGISLEEAALLLQISEEKMKELLFSGIQSLRREWGYNSSFNDCKGYYNYYIDYLERTLERSKKIDFEMHIYHCQHCQEDFGTFQEVMLSLAEGFRDFRMPSGFMEKVIECLAEKEKQRQRKNNIRKKMGYAFVSAFAILISIGVFTGFFTNLYYAWTEENQQLRAFLQQGLGDRLNLEAEGNGIKITIKSVIADDLQTLVFYEIEDTEKDNQYMLNYNDGVYAENKNEIMSREISPMYYPPDLKSDQNNKEKNVYHGMLSLLPIKKNDGTIKLKITKLQKLIRKSSVGDMAYKSMAYEAGEWNFQIPVTKHPSIEYELDEETEVEGIPVRFDKLIFAPTATILHCAFTFELPEKRINGVNFDNIQVNNRKAKADPYGHSYTYGSNNWVTFQTQFDPLFVENPKEVNVQFESVNVTVDEQKTVELDISQGYPQTFEYAGSTISIDNVEVGQPTNVVISNYEIKNRGYEWIHFNVVSDDEYEIISTDMDSKGVIVDKNGIEYDMNETPFIYEEIEQPRYFLTEQSIKLHSNNAEENVIPKWLKIYEYNTTRFLDAIVKINLK
ncbi:DUF4179 domain-containing protein [Lederbergia panacisoli]|uniref:DUF4179 domain-containing protein n=1 Tax=Lederbergia panacisoli TaxID=1255251 RepID=UPI00214BB985|nr:DUF4179 domain-containing protein [Lederbergia panacisoli]MCR2823562.1 DUF4179 domain-containing protein [Lederbergia panacisoli]